MVELCPGRPRPAVVDDRHPADVRRVARRLPVLHGRRNGARVAGTTRAMTVPVHVQTTLHTHGTQGRMAVHNSEPRESV
jgi:hypothetical protein